MTESQPAEPQADPADAADAPRPGLPSIVWAPALTAVLILVLVLIGRQTIAT